MSQSALVTGGAGFIGSHLVHRLLREGWRVRVRDNFSSGSWDNLKPFRADVEVIEGDVRDEELCWKACAGIDSVFHLAAIASVARSVADPLLTHSVNVDGTLNLLTAARNCGVRRFVFSSSAAVYGNAGRIPANEQQQVKPESPYASGKACAEFYCRNFWELYGLETIALRYFNVFGPRQSLASGYAAVIPLFVEAAVTGKTPIIYGDGQQTRDFIYVENVVEANIRAALAHDVAGMTFNIAGGTAISLLNLLAGLERVTSARLKPEFRPARAGDVRHSLADITLARRVLGYQPTVPFEMGLKLTVDAVVSTNGASSRLAVAA